jgi:nucleotide-binding universal stress UspA family protein
LLHVVAPVQYVIDATLPYGYVSGPRDEHATEDLVAAADRELKGLAAHVATQSGCQVDPHVVVSDHTGTAIVDFAKKYDVDLIAMTTRGRGAARLILGIVTDVVLQSATIPMLVLRATYQ